jgi:hypothetical protein
MNIAEFFRRFRQHQVKFQAELSLKRSWMLVPGEN